MRVSLAVGVLRNAIILGSPIGTVLHSDRGSPFCPKAFLWTLKNNNLIGSIGQVDACGNNAAIDSFFTLLQKNVLDRQRWATREELLLEIIARIVTT